MEMIQAIENLHIPEKLFTKPIYFMKDGRITSGMIESIKFLQKECIAFIDIEGAHRLYECDPGDIFMTPEEAVKSFIRKHDVDFDKYEKDLYKKAKEMENESNIN
jgi:hypothetical protein